MAEASGSPRLGRGRRYFGEEDHQVTREDHHLVPAEQDAPRGRRNFPGRDALQGGLVGQADDGPPAPRPADAQEVRRAVRQLLAESHGISVVDEGRWGDAAVERHAGGWKAWAMSERQRPVGREGATPKALAERLSMAPVAELRHLGLRFTRDSQPQPARKSLGAVGEDSPTLISPGVHTALHQDGQRVQAYAGASHARREPEEMSRRYIMSGKDHWASCEIASHGSCGDAQDMSFSNGMERGIGRGKRHIASQDHLRGPAALPRD